MRQTLSRLGPGIMLAATAVGVSHLVFSTQAGGIYGLSLSWLIVVIVLLKYPAFRFAVDYSSATGESLVTAYSRIGRLALVWMAVGIIVDMFISTAAVALVTAGLVISVLGLPYTGPGVAIAMMIVSALLLANGHYAKAELIVKILVLVFSVLVILAMFLSLPSLGNEGRGMFAELTPDRSLALFVIAMAGWMPMPTNGAIMYSQWICEKRASAGERFDYAAAIGDFRLGYGLTLALALCFVVMGTAVLFDTGRVVPESAAGFATELFGIFTSVIGQWVYPVIAIAGIAVIWSTQVALMDACPRIVDRLTGVIVGRGPDAPSRYPVFLLVQVAGVTLLLLTMMHEFRSFVTFATSAGFVASPAIAYYNYRAIKAANVPASYQPTSGMLYWSWAGIFSLTAFAVAFLWTRLV